MILELRDIRLPLPDFTLGLSATLPGPVTGIFGPSGAGKTTLLEIIAGLRRPASGTVTFATRLLDNPARRIYIPAHRRAIGYVPQDAALFPHLSVRANLLYGARRSSSSPTTLTLPAVTGTLDLHPLLDHPIHALSGGEKQRIAIARAILASPALLLLDEPLASLDRALKDRILPYLQRLRTAFGIPILYVSHHLDEIAVLCDHLLVLDRGQCTHIGPVSQLITPIDRPAFALR